MTPKEVIIRELREPTAKMIAASVPAFKEVEQAIKLAWMHGFSLTARIDDPPIKQAWRAMVGASQQQACPRCGRVVSGRHLKPDSFVPCEEL